MYQVSLPASFMVHLAYSSRVSAKPRLPPVPVETRYLPSREKMKYSPSTVTSSCAILSVTGSLPSASSAATPASFLPLASSVMALPEVYITTTSPVTGVLVSLTAFIRTVSAGSSGTTGVSGVSPAPGTSSVMVAFFIWGSLYLPMTPSTVMVSPTAGWGSIASKRSPVSLYRP